MDSMSPSDTITSGQAAKFLDLLSAGLRKSELPSELTQKVLETQGREIVAEFISNLRNRVEAISDMIVRRLTVNRSRSVPEMLDLMGRIQHGEGALETMPVGYETDLEIVFFKPEAGLDAERLMKCFDDRGLKPVDGMALMQFNAEDPLFAFDHPHGTIWQDANERWHHLVFYRYRDRNHVATYVNNGPSAGDGCWWLAGVRKTSAD